MEIRNLEIFVEVAREENISRAAAKLYVSQPSISRQLQELEKELGKKLFERTTYGVKLTHAGILFLERTEDLLQKFHELKVDFGIVNDEVGNIYIGCAETDSIKYLARAAKILKETHPKICFNLYSGNFEDISYRMDNGLLDFYLTLQSVDVSKYNYLILPSPNIWGVIMCKDSHLAEREKIFIEDLRGLPLILSREGMREEYPKWFRDEMDKFQIAATYNLFFNAAIMVREGLGYAITIDNLVNTSADSELCFRPLYPELKSELRFAWKKSQFLTTPAKLLLKKMCELYQVK